MAPRRILIADPDTESIRWLSRALREKGHQVFHAKDGSKALEGAVLRQPDVLLFDDACPLIDARTFLQILKANPRTENIPVLLLTHQYDAANVRVFRDGVLKKPFNQDEVLSRIEQLLHKVATAKDMRQESTEIEGQLSQMGLADLLQVLALNRRSGKLLLSQGTDVGEIFVREGRPIQAKWGTLSSAKALFRLMIWKEGAFAFRPGTVTENAVLDISMEEALLEGHRQADEMARLWQGLGPRHTRVARVSGAQVAEEQHPVTQQVLQYLDRPRSLSEILDAIPDSDVDVLGAVTALLNHRLVEVHETLPSGQGPLMELSVVHALRGRLLKKRETQKLRVCKLFVVAENVEMTQAWADEWAHSWVSKAEDDVWSSGFGTLGRLSVGDGLLMDAVWLPHSHRAEPLWHSLTHGGVGVLLLDLSEASFSMAQFLAETRHLSVVLCGAELPREWKNRHPRWLSSTDRAAALKKLLLQVLEQDEDTH